jgi:hypothetical protein
MAAKLRRGLPKPNEGPGPLEDGRGALIAGAVGLPVRRNRPLTVSRAEWAIKHPRDPSTVTLFQGDVPLLPFGINAQCHGIAAMRR